MMGMCGSRADVAPCRSGETSFEYERAVQPRPKLGRWSAELDELLEGNAAKPAREQLTLIRIFEEFRGRGYDALHRYARRWAKQHGEATAAAYVPVELRSGEAYQFDWSHEVVVLSGMTVIVKAAHAATWGPRPSPGCESSSKAPMPVAAPASTGVLPIRAYTPGAGAAS
jgi:hypothetical protein